MINTSQTPKITANQERYLRQLLSYIDPETGYIDKSYTEQSRDTGYSKQTLINYQKSFIQQGLLHKEVRKTKHGRVLKFKTGRLKDLNDTNLYKVNVEKANNLLGYPPPPTGCEQGGEKEKPTNESKNNGLGHASQNFLPVLGTTYLLKKGQEKKVLCEKPPEVTDWCWRGMCHRRAELNGKLVTETWLQRQKEICKKIGVTLQEAWEFCISKGYDQVTMAYDPDKAKFLPKGKSTTTRSKKQVVATREVEQRLLDEGFTREELAIAEKHEYSTFTNDREQDRKTKQLANRVERWAEQSRNQLMKKINTSVDQARDVFRKQVADLKNAFKLGQNLVGSCST